LIDQSGDPAAAGALPRRRAGRDGLLQSRVSERRVSAVFAAAFTAGAITIFGVVFIAGAALGVDELFLQWRLVTAAAGLAGFAFVDLIAIRKRSYCPLSWRRQTPQSLRFRYGATATVMLWGFDTGLAVTTFRVAALTWAALLLAFLGLAPWQIGFAYALAFVIPVIVILNGQPAASRSSERLEALLRKRTVLQRISATTLATMGTLLLAHLAR
jgi:hypothetical protein